MMKTRSLHGIVAAMVCMLAACGADDTADEGGKVETSGKEATTLAEVPDAVLAAARDARPELEILEAEHEVRDGRDYYDVGGTLPDGSELELDMTRVDGTWTVVEFQRDIGMPLVPDAVKAALAGAQPDWQPDRIIESDQGDGVVIYEFFGPGVSTEAMKVEVKLEAGDAEVLTDEWVH